MSDTFDNDSDVVGLTDAAFQSLHAELEHLEPGLKQRLYDLYRAAAAEYAKSGQPKQLAPSQQTVLRHVAKQLRQREKYSHFTRDALELHILMGIPAAWVEEERKKL